MQNKSEWKGCCQDFSVFALLRWTATPWQASGYDHSLGNELECSPWDAQWLRWRREANQQRLRTEKTEGRVSWREDSSSINSVLGLLWQLWTSHLTMQTVSVKIPHSLSMTLWRSTKPAAIEWRKKERVKSSTFQSSLEAITYQASKASLTSLFSKNLSTDCLLQFSLKETPDTWTVFTKSILSKCFVSCV